MGSTRPSYVEGEDMVCSAWRHAAIAGNAAGWESRTHLNNKFDGDMCSYTCPWTEDAIEEITKLLNSAAFYVGVDNTMAFSAEDDVVAQILASMTTPA